MRARKPGRPPNRIFVSTDRQWAKNKTSICTHEYVRAARLRDTAPDTEREPDDRSVLARNLTRLADSGTVGGGLALADHEVRDIRRAVDLVDCCSCWVEALNMYRRERDWRLACSCADHPPTEQCTCPFCSSLRLDSPSVHSEQ